MSGHGLFASQLLKSGVYTSVRRLFAFFGVNECNGDVTPTWQWAPLANASKTHVNRSESLSSSGSQCQ